MSTRQVRVVELVRVVTDDDGKTIEAYYESNGVKLFEREVVHMGAIEVKHGFIAGHMGPNDEHISPVVPPSATELEP